MKRGGKGGANTLTGLRFEGKADLRVLFGRLPDHELKEAALFRKGAIIGQFFEKHKLYKNCLEPKGVNWKEIISKRLLPDDALFLPGANKIIIFEKKYQEGEGSVDEKLQTADFKKKQYEKLFKPLRTEIRFVWLLNNWFRDEKYRDVLTYINSVGCEYCFEDELTEQKLQLLLQ